ncbi:BatD family protein [Pontibacter sp. G13]|uniref:BatD family protein n=1 Tax=Pontibacter sp. G13 TaxID=3074898 RepID=UPI002889A26D|nr:BatD family protein [Pontibacter sp. G13]WNJ19903.1 BatD family protein [Pontibacter sp. G13]
MKYIPKRLVLVAALICMQVWAFGQNFTAYLGTKNPQVERPFEVTFQLNANARGKFTPPKFEGFQVLSGPNTSRSTQIVNGQVSQSLSYGYVIMARKAGTYTIGSATIETSDGPIKTEPLQVQVTAAAASGQGGNGQGQSASLDDQISEYIFIKRSISKRKAYVGEQLILTDKLYIHTGIQAGNFQLQDPPSYEGFWSENLTKQTVDFDVEVMDGQQYRTAVVNQMILFPNRAGKLELPALPMQCVVQIPDQNRRRRRNIFDDMFPSYQNYPYEFGSKTIPLTVEKLPTSGKPANFSGLVGDFDLDVSVDTKEVETGNPVTYKVKYSGKGNLKKLREPKLDVPRDLEVYDPNIKEKFARNMSGMSGYRAYEYLIIPNYPGSYEIPAVSFSYFNPSTGKYETQSSQAFTIKAEGEAVNGGSAAPGNFSREEIAKLGEDIRYIHTNPTNLTQSQDSFAGSFGFYLLFLLPLGLIGVLSFVKSKRMEAAADVAGTRSKKATKLAKKKLSTAKTHLDGGNEKAFYDEVSRALYGYVEDKLNVGTSEISLDNIKAQFAKRGVSEATISKLTGILETCEMALYAPSAAPKGMQGVYDDSISLIEQVEDELKSAATETTKA